MVRLKVERLRRKMTQQDLGYLARVHASVISRVENGMQVPYPVQAARLARVLGIEESTLLEDVGGVPYETPRTAAVGVH